MFFRLVNFAKKCALTKKVLSLLSQVNGNLYNIIPRKREGDEKNRVKSNTFVSILVPYSRPLTSWCRTHNMEQDKSIFLKQQFLDDLVKLRFNPGGRVAQYDSADKGVSMLVCRSLTALEVEQLRGYEEASELTRSTRHLDEIQKKNPRPRCQPKTSWSLS